ncbi:MULTISPECIES: GlxA family transcriptional regulator [unclassified Duganella]|uniref:GlxA family transcriptional regulator n=1 Tax=unclassified Duganella TaxID=2636909 RepID=UPI0006F52A52|nr:MULTISPECIES: GlxA family transcriptional regulator [unclassified Duganella]KQV53876.1 AraC family transcriptional regulator [Duganella sp. Root336D2]KRB83570.1 AraC family transcriptional regulator [Duganella sp. Root198D2]
MLKIGFLLPPGFQIMGLAAASAFELANTTACERLYDIGFFSAHGGPVANSFGASLETQPLARRRLDTLIVCGLVAPAPTDTQILIRLRAAARLARRTASVCTGTFLLGEAGLIDGRRVTTHWLFARELQQQFPAARVDADRIFINDGPVWTSAGMSTGIDLALGLIEADYGAELAAAVAKKLVVYHRRGGGQSQHSTLLQLGAKSDRIQRVLEYARNHLHSGLSVQELAGVAHLSPRQFSRAFTSETGQSPAKAIEHLRLEAARLMIEQSRHTIEEIAAETGFIDTERMRRAFLRAYGQPPQALRRIARMS